jgi:hypothetical protein
MSIGGSATFSPNIFTRAAKAAPEFVTERRLAGLFRLFKIPISHFISQTSRPLWVKSGSTALAYLAPRRRRLMHFYRIALVLI